MMTQSNCLDIIIVGAGLGGLAAAVALSRNGHRVTVLEATKELVTAGAGLQVPPPSTRILKSWGLENAFEGKLTAPKTFTFHSFSDGRILGKLPITPYCQERFDAPWWCVHRADYQRILFETAAAKGVQIMLDHRVIDVDLNKPAVVVQNSISTVILEADLVIGADGLRSQVRSAILKDADPGVRLRPTSICAYRALVPVEAMNAEEQRRSLMDPENVNADIWLGPSHFMLAYPIRTGSQAQYNLVLVHPENSEHTKHDLPPRFPRPASIPEISAYYSNFCPQVRSVVSVVTPEDQSTHWIKQAALAPKDGILEWKLSDLAELPRWTDQSSRTLIIGDAAHAQRPYMSAGASCAVEDAAALAVFLSFEALREHSLKELVDAFVTMRKPRVSKMQALSAEDSESWSIGQGPSQIRRDQLLAHLGDKDRQSWRDAMSQMKTEGVGSFNFGDPEVMDWWCGYDVVEDARSILKQMKACTTEGAG